MTQVDDSMEKVMYIVLLMDEMITDLVYDKHTGKIYYTMQACIMHGCKNRCIDWFH